MKYRPDIDGLRAVAVMSVVLYHAGLGCPGGYVGVDIFFVISGFLIAQVLVQKIQAGTFSYADFWERRARRLLPALALTLLVTALAGSVFLLPEDLTDLGKSLLSQPLLSVNVYFCRAVKAGYFGDIPEIRPSLHTWSLAVEEQFYLLFPALLLLLYRIRGQRGVAPGLAFLGALSLALCIILTRARPILSFFLLPTRAWELILGALLTLEWDRLRSLSASTRSIAAQVGALFLVSSIALFSDETPFPGSAALVPCIGTALLILSYAPERPSWCHRLLTLPVVTWVGLMSYSVYLWHWPLYAFSKYVLLDLRQGQRCLFVFVTCAMGFLSWKFVEQPVRQKRVFKTRASLASLAITTFVFCLFSGCAFLMRNGYPERWPVQAIRWAEARNSRAELQVDGVRTLPQRFGHVAKGSPASFLLWGDSHAMALRPALERLATKNNISGIQVTRSATPPLFGAYLYKGQLKRDSWGTLIEQVVKTHRLQSVILGAYWNKYSGPDFAAEVRNTVQILSEWGITDFWLVRDNPDFPCDAPRGLAMLARFGPGMVDIQRSYSDYLQRNKNFDLALDGMRDRVRVIDLPSKLFVNGEAILTDGQHCLYHDFHHLSIEGSYFVQDLFEPVFTDLGAQNTRSK